MYAALWRALPGPVWVRLLLVLLALAAVVVVCFTWVFPQIAPLLPLNDPDVRGP
ncbi:hypothetical protein SGUI_2614 [Serinicoccus hydrothermalis]|uniref:Uncharacterized protein n=1 Tax=Serinicoccus hydrothermalis TaxID=1758689 RepID=A0A1B1NF04_9MICO|nr:hypothetical protein [Serinicoccus hydrothermalis]ANS80010.1 hypothetical protein SGUI_2614 [Serinicoccus hydrothermalis]